MKDKDMNILHRIRILNINESQAWKSHISSGGIIAMDTKI